MPLEAVTLKLHRDGGQQTLQLALDDGQYTQKLMLADVRAGNLYEPQTSYLLATELREGDVFVDVGAHVGYFTLLAAAIVGPAGRVFSFEPDYANYQHLLHHLKINGLHQVRAFNWAVSDHCGLAELFVNADNDGGHALWDPGHHPFNERSRAQAVTRPVCVTSLDDALAGVDPRAVRYVKIDTEGVELDVLRGASGLLTKGSPSIVCEINAFGLAEMGAGERALRDFMAGLGYRAYAFEPRTITLEPIPDEDLAGADAIVNVIFRKGTARMRRARSSRKASSQSAG